MNVMFNPAARQPQAGRVAQPKAQPQFGVSLHPLTPVMNKLLEIAPNLERPALQQVTDLLMAHQDYKATLAGVFANGDLAIVTANTADDVGDGFAGVSDGPSLPDYRVYFGQPGRLVEYASTSALHMSSCADIQFADPNFRVSTDSGFATGRISVTVNGQQAERATRL